MENMSLQHHVFRDEIVDDLHNQYFMKTELMIFNTIDNDINCTDILNIISNNYDNQKIYEFDIIVNIDQLDIELGSYGIRSRLINNKTMSWIYATGCDLPKLSNVIKKK